MSKRTTTISAAPEVIGSLVDSLVGEAGQEVKARAYRTANELQNQLNKVLRGERHGRQYIVPGTGSVKYNKREGTANITYKRYTASAPGEPPANRTGAFRLSWHRRTFAEELDGHNFNVHGVTESDLRVGKHLLGEILDEGTGRMAPRPYRQRVVDAAMPRIQRIYKETYFGR